MPKGGVTLKGKKQNNTVLYKGGSLQSSIVALGLDGIVTELRLKKGWGGIKIAKYINGNAAKYLPDDGTIVTVPTINRYLKSAGLVEQKKDDAKEAVNVYKVECDSLEKLQFIAETIFDRIEACSEIDQDDDKYDDKALVDLAKSYREITTKISSTTSSIARMHEKVYSWSNCAIIAKRTIEMIKERDPMLAKEIQDEFKLDPILNECYRKIKMEE